MGHSADECLKQTLELAARMLELADQGDAARQDVGCGVLYGVLRDSAYKLKRLAEGEREKHLRQKRWEEDAGPETTPTAAKLTGDKGYRDFSGAVPLTGGKTMITSEGYLRQGFSVEDLLRSRYLVFARQAEKEGYPEIANLFRATAREEQVNSMTMNRESQY